MDLLTTAPMELAARTAVPEKELAYFVEVLRNEVPVVGDSDSVVATRFFTAGDDKLDVLLGGGVHLGHITEIFGESATGKSQLCMQLTKCVSLEKEHGGMGAKSVYISTEGQLETRRLVEINEDLDSVFCINCMDLETQEHIMGVQLPVLIETQRDVRLVIIDSISHHLRVELENKGYKSYLSNKLKMTEICKNLLDLCSTYGIALVVTNQISDLPEKEILQSDYKKISLDYQQGWLSGWDDEMISRDEIKGGVPTLGLAWSNNVPVRVLMKKRYQRGDDDDDEEYWKVRRSLKLVYSPFGEDEGEVSFEITKRGIESCVGIKRMLF